MFFVKEFKLNKKDWKFWYKLICGIMPIVSICIFIIAQYFDLTSKGMLVTTNSSIDILTNELRKKMLTWNNGKIFLYCITRNIFLFTTIGNIFFAVFFINSANNHQREGDGKIDNPFIGLFVIILILFVILFYNLSKISSSKNTWYANVSWVCEHSVFGILGAIYFFVWYPIEKLKINKKETNQTFLYSFFVIHGYFLFFWGFGQILYELNAFPLFGDMSATGYFPYYFLDFNSMLNIRSFIKTLKFSLAEQWFSLLTLFIVITIGIEGSLYGFINLRYKKEQQKLINIDNVGDIAKNNNETIYN